MKIVCRKAGTSMTFKFRENADVDSTPPLPLKIYTHIFNR
jgi:hypothetical protein